MDDRLTYTIGEMYRLAGLYSGDTGGLPTSLPHLFDVVRRIPYVPDRDEFGQSAELLKRPTFTLTGGGDCDDKAILAGAVFARTGTPFHFVTAAYDEAGDMQHVYPTVYDAARRAWVAFDATYPQNQYGVERPAVRKIIWENPMTRTSRLGVTTLEGFGSMGQSPAQVSQALTSVPNQANWESWFTGIVGGSGSGPAAVSSSTLTAAGAAIGSVIPGVGTIAGTSITSFLASLGITIRGKTGHLSYTEADTEAKKYTQNVVDFVRSLPADGRTHAYELANAFYARFLQDMGKWWDGAMNSLDQKWRAQGGFSTPDGTLWFDFFIPAYTILFQSDVTTVQNDFYHWYFLERYKPIFGDPLAAYLNQKLGEVVNAQPSGEFVVTKGGASPITSSLPGAAGLVALLGLGLVFGGLGKKRRAYSHA